MGKLFRNRKFSMTASLAIAFGGMMALALAIVITGQFLSAGKNTQDLLSDRADLVLDHLTGEVGEFLGPAEHALKETAKLMERFPGQWNEIDNRAAGIIAALPQLVGIGYVTGGQTIRILGEEPDSMPRQQIVPRDTLMPPKTPDHDGVYWLDPVYSPLIGETILNARLHLPAENGGERMLVTAVRVGEMGKLINRLSEDIGFDVFVLHNQQDVIAYTGYDPEGYVSSAAQPLIKLAGISNPYLRDIWNPERKPLGILEGTINGEAWVLPVEDYTYGFIYRQVEGFSQLPWLVGMFLDLRENSDEVERLFRSAIIALIISMIAILITLKLGGKLSKPVERLAERSQSIRQLTASNLPPLPGSRIKELDSAAQAFNSMSSALHWFETYLPKRLVAQLMESGSPEDVTSDEREVTVMFTDIIAFSSRAAMLTPAETADFLNSHFDIVESCVAAEDGLVDKYIGDSVMAFWGAPQHQPNHAARAIACALRIREKLNGGDTGIRIGIHTGTVLVGNIGAKARLDYTIVGDTVNIAQRIEQYGKNIEPHSNVVIVASQTSADQAGSDASALGEVQLRGQNKPIGLVVL